jgi:protoporphyrinogen/coproporphyrinogen III oxidase
VLSPQRIAVVGGGISGLAAAYFLQRVGGESIELTLVEAGQRLGGKIATRSVGGVVADIGPDTLTQRPELVELLDGVQLADVAVAPARRAASVWSRGRLRALPPLAGLGIPDRALPLVRSRLLSPAGAARAGLDVVLPRRSLPSDPSIGQLLRPRFGDQLFDRLVAALLGGMHAGAPDALSAASTVPELLALARDNRSLYLALRRRRKAAGGNAPAAPRVAGLAGGLEQLVHRIAAVLDPASVRLDSPAVALEPVGQRFRLALGGPRPTTLDVDRVVLAAPAFVTADLLAAFAPEAAAALRAVPYADVVSVALAYPRATVDHLRPMSGFLVPPAEGRLISGCTWVTAKWPQYGDPASAVFRVIVTGERATSLLEMDDEAVVARVGAEVADALQLSGPPSQTLVRRLPQAIPQYIVGHGAGLDRIERTLTAVPGLHLTGAAYRGASVSACVAQAKATIGAIVAEPAASGLGARVRQV